MTYNRNLPSWRDCTSCTTSSCGLGNVDRYDEQILVFKLWVKFLANICPKEKLFYKIEE